MRVYVLRLEGEKSIERAFDVISNARNVSSCIFEPELSRVRFVAPRNEADALAERIYLDGGLIWCSRHDVK